MEPDDLYGLPLERFIPERGALAKALRADKRREEAAEVAGLRKPSVAAWAVNQLVRTQGGAVQDLYDAGDALRAAQSDLLAGRGDGRALRAAGEQERAAVDRLVDAARGLLSSEGHELSPAVVDRVADTLHAAALDEDARAQVRDGRLERELRHVGLGLGEGAASSPPRPAGGGKAAKPPAAAKRTESPRTEPAKRAKRPTPADREREAGLRAEAQRAERERAEARKAARAAEVTARRRAERSRRALKAAEERRERASAALEEADDALASARAEADAAADAHERAQAELDES